jgi:hypothetical protein
MEKKNQSYLGLHRQRIKKDAARRSLVICLFGTFPLMRLEICFFQLWEMMLEDNQLLCTTLSRRFQQDPGWYREHITNMEQNLSTRTGQKVPGEKLNALPHALFNEQIW